MITNLSETRVDPEIAPVLGYFNEILDIPRPSGKEQKIREYLIRFALPLPDSRLSHGAVIGN